MDEGFRESECLPPGILQARLAGIMVPPTALFPEGGILQLNPHRFYPIHEMTCHVWDRITPTPTQWAQWIQSWQDYAVQWNALCTVTDPSCNLSTTVI